MKDLYILLAQCSDKQKEEIKLLKLDQTKVRVVGWHKNLGYVVAFDSPFTNNGIWINDSALTTDQVQKVTDRLAN